MTKEKEYGNKARLLRVMIALLDRPFGYTARQLAGIYNVIPETIRKDFNVLRDTGFVLKKDDKHRYALVENNSYKQLKDLLHFTEEDQALLHMAIDHIAANSKRGERLKKKLVSLYDYHRLGNRKLRKPYLAKVDLLIQGEKEERQVILMNYHSSNSNTTSNRLVEPFDVNPGGDTLQAFDVEKKEIRHFLITRIGRVKLTDNKWLYKGHHNLLVTDPFRIVNNKQVMVHLRLTVRGRNELIGRFPLTKNYIEESQEDEVYDFQCKVNRDFLGITGFILGNYDQIIEIITPDSLSKHLENEIKKMKF